MALRKKAGPLHTRNIGLENGKRFKIVTYILPGFRALKAGDRVWSVHKTLFGFRAPLFQLFI